MTLKEYLAEQMEDPEFREAYEMISEEEEDQKLAAAMAGEPGQVNPSTAQPVSLPRAHPPH